MNFDWPVGSDERVKSEQKFQGEIREFISKFSWSEFCERRPDPDQCRVVDVGAKNFSLAPVWQEWVKSLGLSAEIVGIEIDAYRRLSNGHSRADYGKFFSKAIPKGKYLAEDFLRFSQPCDLVCLLNPFVTSNPHLAWGLPLSLLRPTELWKRVAELLKPRQGWCLLSSPTMEEFHLNLELAHAVGLKLREKKNWDPETGSQQTQSRLGALFSV